MPSAQLTKLAQRVLRVLNSNNLSNKLYHISPFKHDTRPGCFCMLEKQAQVYSIDLVGHCRSGLRTPKIAMIKSADGI